METLPKSWKQGKNIKTKKTNQKNKSKIGPKGKIKNKKNKAKKHNGTQSLELNCFCLILFFFCFLLWGKIAIFGFRTCSLRDPSRDWAPFFFIFGIDFFVIYFSHLGLFWICCFVVFVLFNFFLLTEGGMGESPFITLPSWCCRKISQSKVCWSRCRWISGIIMLSHVQSEISTSRLLLPASGSWCEMHLSNHFQHVSTCFNHLKVLHILACLAYRKMRAAKPQACGYQAQDVRGHQMVLGLECIHAGNLVASEAKRCHKNLTSFDSRNFVLVSSRFDASAGFRWSTSL